MNAVIAPRTSTTAIVSLIFGVLAWFALPLLGAIIAVICGHAARSEIRASNGQLDGAGLALAGLALGWVHLLLGVIFVLAIFAIPFSVLGGFGHWLHAVGNCTTSI